MCLVIGKSKKQVAFQELVEAELLTLKTAQKTTVVTETQFQSLWFNTSVQKLKCCFFFIFLLLK